MSKTVLIVDDSSAIRKIVAGFLKSDGWTCIEAESLAKMQEQLSMHTPQLFVIDESVAGNDAVVVLNAVRKLSTHQKTPALMICTEAKVSLVVPGLQAGFGDYIFRPFTNETFLGKVRTLVA